MKRLFLACLGLAVLASPAGAADLGIRPAPYYKGPPPAFIPPYTWSGFYIGVNGGGGWGHSNWDTAGGISTSGGVVGGTVGYNYQYDRAVFGVEGDIDWANINGGTTTAGCPLGCQTKDTWLSTVRGRLGYAAGRFMPFVTGGAAFGDIRASTPALAGGNTTNAGWTVGAGIEFALVGNWTAKAEYLYVDLGKLSCGAGCGAPVDNVSFTANIVRGGINYRF
jgi:outer membrane immunogenic protein